MNINIFKRPDKDKYQLIKSPYLNKKNKMLVQLAKQYDGFGYMKTDLGKEIERLFKDESYIVGIHRTGYSEVNDEYLNEVFNRGLINNMDTLNYGFHADKDYLDIKKTVDLFYDPILLNGAVKTANRYKQSAGSIIIKIPKSYLGLEDGEIKPIYYKDGVSNKLLPEYIYGYLPVSGDGILGDMVHNPNYTDEHTYIDSEGTLMYESRVIIRSRRGK